LITGIRIPNQSRVGDSSQLKQKMSLFAFFALGVLAGRAVARAFEVHIPLSSCSAAAQHELMFITGEIDNWNCRLLRTRRWTLDVGRWMLGPAFGMVARCSSSLSA